MRLVASDYVCWLPRQVKLGVDEKRGDGGEAVRLLEEFGEAAVAAARPRH